MGRDCFNFNQVRHAVQNARYQVRTNRPAALSQRERGVPTHRLAMRSIKHLEGLQAYASDRGTLLATLLAPRIIRNWYVDSKPQAALIANLKLQ